MPFKIIVKHYQRLYTSCSVVLQAMQTNSSRPNVFSKHGFFSHYKNTKQVAENISY